MHAYLENFPFLNAEYAYMYNMILKFWVFEQSLSGLSFWSVGCGSTHMTTSSRQASRSCDISTSSSVFIPVNLLTEST